MKVKTLAILLISLGIYVRCNEPITPKYMSEYITEDDIQKVEMNNVYGTFFLNENQLKKFRKQFLATKTVPGLTVKTGSLSIIITLKNGETYVARGNSSSEFLEVSAKIATLNKDELKQVNWLVLDTKDTNFNNYKP